MPRIAQYQAQVSAQVPGAARAVSAPALGASLANAGAGVLGVLASEGAQYLEREKAQKKQLDGLRFNQKFAEFQNQWMQTQVDSEANVDGSRPDVQRYSKDMPALAQASWQKFMGDMGDLDPEVKAHAEVLGTKWIGGVQGRAMAVQAKAVGDFVSTSTNDIIENVANVAMANPNSESSRLAYEGALRAFETMNFQAEPQRQEANAKLKQSYLYGSARGAIENSKSVRALTALKNSLTAENSSYASSLTPSQFDSLLRAVDAQRENVLAEQKRAQAEAEASQAKALALQLATVSSDVQRGVYDPDQAMELAEQRMKSAKSAHEVHQLQNVWNIANSKFQQERAATEQAAFNQFGLTIIAGEAEPIIADTLKTGSLYGHKLSPQGMDKFVAMSSPALQQSMKLRDSLNLFNEAESGRLPVDKSDKKALASLALASEEILKGEDDPARRASRIQAFVGNTGVIPGPMKAEIQSMLLSKNESDVQRGMEVYRAIAQYRPDALDFLDDRAVRQAEELAPLMEYMPLADAQAHVVERQKVSSSEAEQRKKSAQLFNGRKALASEMTSMKGRLFGDRLFGDTDVPLSRRFAINDTGLSVIDYGGKRDLGLYIPDGVGREFEKLYREHYVRTGDAQSSESLAKLQLAKRVSASYFSVPGRVSLMKDAPEKAYGLSGLNSFENYEWMLRDLQSQIKDSVTPDLDVSKATLMPEPGAADPKTGRPVYNVYYVGNAGVPIKVRGKDGNALRFVPDANRAGVVTDERSRLQSESDVLGAVQSYFGDLLKVGGDE